MYGLERLTGSAGKPTHSSEYLETFIPGDTVRMHETVCPDRESAERPVSVLINGWGSNHAILEEAANSLARQGERVVTMDLPRRTLCEGNALLPRQAALQTVVQRVNDKLRRPVHLIGHSTGGIDGIRTLNLYRAAGVLDLVSGFTLVAPAGMLDDSTSGEVVWGAVLETVDQVRHPIELSRRFGDLSLAGVGMLWDRRLLTAEAKEVIHTDVIPELLEVAAAPDSPHIRIVQCADDLLYRDERVSRRLRDMLEGTNIELEVVQARHTDLTYAHPGLLAAIQRHIGDTLSGPNRYPRSPQSLYETA